ncbi:hypothetical protein SK128_016906 [Halocaridina rubra]|uniref:Uncharacterized protein n=1 Tax=Halocaridina rubra TaxID=373956 RepID=A0AAN9A0H6_HALRR
MVQDMYSEPLYHTLYETFALVDELYDPSFSFLSAVTMVLSILTVDFADLPVLPLSLVEYSNFISSAYDELVVEIGPLVTARNLTLDYFGDAVGQFASATQKFSDNLQFVDTSKHIPYGTYIR